MPPVWGLVAIFVGGLALWTLIYLGIFSAFYSMEPRYWGPNAELKQARTLAQNIQAERQSSASEVGSRPCCC